MEFNREAAAVRRAASQIKLLLLDADGVLTDGGLYYSDSGEEMKRFCVLDGHGIKRLLASGVEVGIISGRSSAALQRRAQELGIELLHQGREDKLDALREIARQQGVAAQEICYVGDDLPDLPALQEAGLACSVPNAHGDVQRGADLITAASGGSGAVREISDFILAMKAGRQPATPL